MFDFFEFIVVFVDGNILEARGRRWVVLDR
jgi:hypothetical protein